MYNAAMPSPTVLYVVATIVIALLLAWVGLVSKSRAVAWEATPEERERFAKLRPFAEGDFAGVADTEEPPAAPGKAKRKKAKAKADEGAKVGEQTSEPSEAAKADEQAEAEADAEKAAASEEGAEEGEKGVA